jgi:hypothetical protein
LVVAVNDIVSFGGGRGPRWRRRRLVVAGACVTAAFTWYLPGMRHSGGQARPLHARAPRCPVNGLRVWLVGFGTVGRWVAGALHAQAAQLETRYGAGVTVVGIGNARPAWPNATRQPTSRAMTRWRS